MRSIKVNFENLTENERKTLLKLVEKSNQEKIQLCDIEVGKTFKIGNTEFIKFADEYGATTAVAKDIIFNSRFGDTNNFAESDIMDKLNKEFLPKIAGEIGLSNILEFETDLTTLDGLKTYGVMTSKISLPTFDFYRKNVSIFDKYKLDKWWWLATPDTAYPHKEANWVVCVSPSGDIDFNGGGSGIGVRPFLRFVSSIYVSCED